MFREGYLRLLDDGEQRRRTGYRRERDRARFTLAAALLKAAVARELDVVARDVSLDRTCFTCGGPHGRPTVLGARVSCSASHSGPFVAVATSSSGQVGIDVEQITDLAFEPLLDQIVANPERVPRTAEEFFRIWTRKEAVLKATGEGLRTPMTSVSMTGADEPPRLLSPTGRLTSAEVFDLKAPIGALAAVCRLDVSGAVVEEADAQELLDALG